MTAPLAMSTHRRPDGTPVLTVAGEIDMSNAGAFRAALADARLDGRLVVDLTAVEYLDTAGLTALFGHADHLEVVATPLLGPVLKVSGLAGIATVREVDSGQDAAASPPS